MKTLCTLVIFLSLQIPLEAIAKPTPPPKTVTNKPVIDNGSCYFVNSSGKVINLSTLCGLPESRITEDKKLLKGVFQAKIKRREGGIPVIDVYFGNQKFEMILDTGASNTVITPNMAQALGIVTVKKSLFDTVGSNNLVVPLGYVSKMEVDGLVANNILVGIVPSLKIGLLGNDFYGGFDVTVKKDSIEFRTQTK